MKAERDATAAHQSLADARSAADASVAAKEREVAARLAALDASTDHWPAPVRAKVEIWQQRVSQLEARVAALQAERGEVMAASEAAMSMLRVRLAAKEAERTDAVTAAAREAAVLETRLREATNARAALEAERWVPVCVSALLCLDQHRCWVECVGHGQC